MRTLIRKVLRGAAAVLALSVAGSIASGVLDYAADVGNTATAASMPAAVETSRDALTGDPLRRDDIRWAQVELRYRGLYQGSVDGVLGRHALSQFQQIDGLGRTVSLDARTWEALTRSGIPAIAERSRDARAYRN